MKEKVILAYSGGLDTTAIIPWLKENFDYEVICVCIDCGQEEELNGLDERAKLSGASKLYIEDIVDEFCDDYIVPCVQANAVYENKYLLGTSMARPGIAKKLVEIASQLNLPEGTVVSLMSQYTPCAKAAEHPPLDRRISKYEYEIALDAMIDLGFDNGYVQSRRSAQKDFIPDFQSHEGLL